jgi:predicted nucleic acid-binding protein
MSLWLADTNVLLRAIQPDNPTLRTIARDALKAVYRRGDSVCVFPQNLIEFWSVSTRPIGVNGLGVSLSETERNVGRCESLFTVLPETHAIFPEWKRLVTALGVSGVRVHDARLVAAMNVHGVKNILTFDVDDFTRRIFFHSAAEARISAIALESAKVSYL